MPTVKKNIERCRSLSKDVTGLAAELPIDRGFFSKIRDNISSWVLWWRQRRLRMGAPQTPKQIEEDDCVPRVAVVEEVREQERKLEKRRGARSGARRRGAEGDLEGERHRPRRKPRKSAIYQTFDEPWNQGQDSRESILSSFKRITEMVLARTCRVEPDQTTCR